MIDLVGKHVCWEKIEGPAPTMKMPVKKGLGRLIVAEEGKSMIIVGDSGITTSTVKSIHATSSGTYYAYTLNSIYRVNILNSVYPIKE